MTIAFVGAIAASGPYTADATATLAGVGANDVQFAWLACLENNAVRPASGWTVAADLQTGTTAAQDFRHTTLYWRRGPGTFTAPVPSTFPKGAWILGIVAYSGLARSGNPYLNLAIAATQAAPSVSVNSATTALRLWSAIGSKITSTGTTERITSYTGSTQVITVGDDAVSPPSAPSRSPASWSATKWTSSTVVLAPYTSAGSVIVGGVKKPIAAMSVIVGGVKKPVTTASVIVGGVKKPLA